MKTENNCPNCKKPLSGDALQGLCPDCLLKAGWPTTTEDGASGQGFTPPPIEELVRLFPKLEILELIGRGGMGAVFKARQSHLDRMVALKILPIEKGSDPGFAERFSREAQALAKLSHRHIVSVHDFGQVEGFHYFLMEYVDGLNLRQIQQAGILAPHEALEIVPQICEALQFAHDNGVVHRDIKPENILLDQTGCIKIADFGLAKILGTERTNFTLTEPNHVMGTPHYMAPEQVEHPRDVDHRADIYSLGVVFYELLTGELPLGKFAAPSKKVQVDVRLDDVVLRSLEKEPELRYQHVSEVGTEVKTIATGPRADDRGRRTACPERSRREDGHALSDEALAEIKRSLRIPAMGVFVSGCLNLAVLCVLLIGAIVGGRVMPSPLEIVMSVLVLSLVVVILGGSSCMRRLTHYRLAVDAAVLSILLSVGSFIGLMFGVWALVLLTRKEVRDAFKQNRRVEGLPSVASAQEGKSRYDFNRILRRLWYLLLIIGLLSMVSYIVPGVQRYFNDRGRFHMLRFSPVVERAFKDSNLGPGKLVLWDLDSDTVYYPTDPIAMPTQDQLQSHHSGAKLRVLQEWQRWVKSTGADLALIGGQTRAGWKLIGLGAERLDIRPSQRPFEGVSAKHLVKRETRILWVPGRRDMPTRDRVICFQTNKGVPGVLELNHFREMSDIRDILTIRYKLLESRKASQETVSSAPIDPEVISGPNAKQSTQEDGQVADFNDPGFWGTQIIRHLEAVRTLDVALETERQVFAEDQKVPDKRYRYRIDLKWDRDNKWIDCSSKQVGENRATKRVIQGAEVAWGSRGDNDWTKLKAGSSHFALTQFSYFGQVRKNAYEHGFGVARGILCSHMLHSTQTQGAVDWGQAEFKHRVDSQGRYVLEMSQMTPGLDGEQVEAGMVLIGQWEHGAFKLLELRGICRAYDMDLLYEGYADHVHNQGAWVPRQVTEYDWITPEPGASDSTNRLREKRITTVQRLVANRPMLAQEFDDFQPPAGSRVTDTIRDTHYTVWPDLEMIRANGGKQRVSVQGRVYLDGRPGDRIAISTWTRYDPNDESDKPVRAETDVNGQFELPGLVPGFSYRIKVKDEAGHTAETTVKLSDQGEDYQGLKIDMTSGLTVSGRVSDVNDLPIENALVRFRGKPTVKTDAEGRYTVNGLYADQGYEVQAGARGYAPSDPGGDVITDNLKIQLDPNGHPNPFDIILEPETLLHGRVIDQDGKPVEGVRVNVWSARMAGDLPWQWYDTYTDPNGQFRIGNLGDRIYGFFIGQYGSIYHNPTESPIVIRVMGDTFMVCPPPGRTLVEDRLRARAEVFESPYHQYFRLKEFRKASNRNQGGKLVSQWLEQLADPNDASQCEHLARLGSVPAYQAHDTLEQILGGSVVQSPKGAITHFNSNMGGARDVGPCPAHLVRSQDPNVIGLAMRALARSGFITEHAQLLIDKLGHQNAQVHAYALVTLAEMTGVYEGSEKSQWQTWLDQYRQYRSDLDTRGNYRLFAGVCRIARDHELTPKSVERIMAAWQGGSAGALRFREILGSQRGADVWRVLASINTEGDKPIQYGDTRGYWGRDMFGATGYRNHDLKVQFARPCRWGDKTFEPDRWYVIPALFRDGYQGKWEIVDLRLEDIQ